VSRVRALLLPGMHNRARRQSIMRALSAQGSAGCQRQACMVSSAFQDFSICLRINTSMDIFLLSRSGIAENPLSVS